MSEAVVREFIVFGALGLLSEHLKRVSGGEVIADIPREANAVFDGLRDIGFAVKWSEFAPILSDMLADSCVNVRELIEAEGGGSDRSKDEDDAEQAA
ncbi:hypothetical protein MKY63_00850 [Paenibacillus sp. FSL R7-0189]|uniref:hypothetical protein n=1 Tax=Paenibacillus sp. FSL R7-0189 TaxID=2921673 RepID=UPI0030D931DA